MIKRFFAHVLSHCMYLRLGVGRHDRKAMIILDKSTNVGGPSELWRILLMFRKSLLYLHLCRIDFAHDSFTANVVTRSLFVCARKTSGEGPTVSSSRGKGENGTTRNGQQAQPQEERVRINHGRVAGFNKRAAGTHQWAQVEQQGGEDERMRLTVCTGRY